MTDTTAVELPPGVVLAALPDTAGAHMVYRFDGQEPDQVELSATARLSGTRVLVGEDDRPSLDILERAELVSRRTRPAAPATLTDTAPQGTLGVSPTTAEAEPLAKAVMAEVGKRASVPQGGVQIRIGRAHGDLAEHPDLGTDYRVRSQHTERPSPSGRSSRPTAALPALLASASANARFWSKHSVSTPARTRAVWRLACPISSNPSR